MTAGITSARRQRRPTGSVQAVRAMLATAATALAETWSNRRGFWIQMTTMVANDVVWILFWLFFFQRFESVRGWDFGDMILLYSVLATTTGIVFGLLANARMIGALIDDGGLDAALLLPTPTLAHLLVSRIDMTFVGDIFFGLGLYVILADPSPVRTVVFLGCVIAAVVVSVGFLVTAGSLAFWSAGNETGHYAVHILTLFAAYPIDLFSSTARIVLYLVVPAGFVTGVPVRLLNEFDWRWAAALAAASAVFGGMGVTVFRRGLRRYASGSVWFTG